MNPNSPLNIGWLPFLAPVVLFWQQAKSLIIQAFSLLIRLDKLRFINPHEATDFVSFLASKGKFIPFGNVKYDQKLVYSKTQELFCVNFFKNRSKFLIILNKCIPVIVTPGPTGMLSILYVNLINLQSYIKEYNLNTIMEEKERAKSHNLLQGPGFYMHECKGKSLKAIKNISRRSSPSDDDADDDAGFSFGPNASSGGGASSSQEFFLDYSRTKDTKLIPSIALEPGEFDFHRAYSTRSKFYFSEEGNRLLTDVINWLAKKDWYVNRDITWKRGTLLYGKPGTGKSALVKEVAKKLRMPLYYMDIGTMDDQEFDRAIKLHIIDEGQILLFEDIDAVFEGRTNLLKSSEYGGLSFDYFINRLSGVNAIPNSYVVITTNHPEKLDPALLRDGRIDNSIELGNMPVEGKRFVAEKMLDRWPELIPQVVTDDVETAAEFENRVTKLALAQIWKNEDSPDRH